MDCFKRTEAHVENQASLSQRLLYLEEDSMDREAKDKAIDKITGN